MRTRKIDHIWSYSGRESSLIAEHKPLAYLIMNAHNLGASTNLTFNQVKQVFSEVIFYLDIYIRQFKLQRLNKVW
jgi:hypothetical protein